MPLPDPCPECGFQGSRLTVGDLEVVIASLPRRWSEVLAAAAARREAEPAVSELARRAAADLVTAIGVARGGQAATGGRESPVAAAEDLLRTLRGLDDPWERAGVEAAVREAAHSATHHLREAERQV